MFSARVVIVSLGNKTKVKKMRRKQNKHGTKIYGAEQHQGSLAAVMGQDCRVRHYLRRNRGNLTAMTPDTLLVGYTFVSHLQGRKVYFGLTKVCDSSG